MKSPSQLAIDIYKAEQLNRAWGIYEGRLITSQYKDAVGTTRDSNWITLQHVGFYSAYEADQFLITAGII